MKKFFKIMALTSLLTISMTTAAFAGTWKQNDHGQWWWQEDDKSYPSSTWEWIDSDGDGIAECYYFDENGYLLTGTTTPDGYTVNDSGAWVDQGMVRQKATSPNASNAMQDEGMQLLQAANQKFSQLDSVDAKAKIQCNLSEEGETLPISLDLLLQYHNLYDSNMEFLVSATMNLDDETDNLEVFYTNGYLYLNMDDEKEKYKLDYNIYFTDALNEMQLTNPNWELYTDVQVETDENGNKILTYSVDKDKLLTTLKDLDVYKEYLTNDMMDCINFNQMGGKIIINPEGYFTKNILTASATCTVDEETANIDFSIDVDYNNPGQPVSIAFPSTKGYEDASF